MDISATQVISAKVASHRDAAVSLFAQLAHGRLPSAGVMRDTYGPGENRGHEVVANYASQLGLEIKRDAAANTYMTLPGRNRNSPRVIIGSHLDSVPNGGNYDGAAGVVAGLIALSSLKSIGFQPESDITVMGIRAEESIWFQISYIGSRSALGSLPSGALEAKRFDTGRTLSQHLAECGGDPDAIRNREAALDPQKVRAFLELHIEQAPTLLEAGKPVGICTHIPGNFRYPFIHICGRHDHVGMPRRFRQDAVVAGSEFVVELDRLWAERDANGTPMAITVGRSYTNPAAHGLTIVPGELELSLDVRACDDAILGTLEKEVLHLMRRIGEGRNVEFRTGARAGAPIGVCAPELSHELADAAASLRVDHDWMVSPASHDAAAFAQAGVPIGMIFIRNENGSHNPAEHMEIDDFLAGTSVLTLSLQRMLS